MIAPEAFAVELGRALTGEALDLHSPEPEELISELSDLGYGFDRLGEIRRAQQEAEEPWPFPVRVEIVKGIGFALFHARLQILRELLDLTGLQPQPRAERALNADERRLIADRPPHWG